MDQDGFPDAGSVHAEEIYQMKIVFGCISDEDCHFLVQQFGGSSIHDVTMNVYEAMEQYGCDSVSDLLCKLKQNSTPRASRSTSLETGIGNQRTTGETWMLARSKSSTSMNRAAGNKQTASSKGSLLEPSQTSSSMPFSGTRNPIQFRRSSRTIDPANLQACFTQYLQDTEMRKVLYDIYESDGRKLLILMRGASGSGKTTLASIIWAITTGGELCSADNFFLSRSGIYKFNRAALPQAHESCRNHCKAALARGDQPIIIDNTNTRVDEMMPYVEMAVDYNYEVIILEPKTEWKTKAGVLAQKNVHGVYKKIIEDQLDRFEKTTAKAMVDKVLKRQCANRISYKPNQELEWGASTVDTFTEPWVGSGFRGLPGSQGPFNSVPGKIKSAGASPVPWTEPPSTTPPSPLLLSDLLPDLTRGSNGTAPKSKRSAKRAGKSGNGAAIKIVPGSAQRVLFEDPAHVEFEKLRKLFPEVELEKLEQIFNTYECDVDGCASALLEEGIEMTGSLDGDEEQTKESEEVEGAVGYDYNGWETSKLPQNDIFNSNLEYNGTAFTITDEEVETESLNITEPYADYKSYDTENFEMVLPVEFARQLLCVYGHPDDERRPLTLNHLTVNLSADFAFELYKALYMNMFNAEDDDGFPPLLEEGSTRSSSPTSSINDHNDEEFNAIAISLSQMELETNSDDPQLATIMDLESKIHQHTIDSLKPYSAQNRTMAQNINFSMLKQEFPFLDASVVDEVYTQCYLNVAKARACLNEMYPQSVSGTLTSKSAPVASTWKLKYNPKDVRLYSSDDIKNVKKQHEELERKFAAKLLKIKECYEKAKNSSNPQIKAHYISESKTISDEMKNLSDEMQYYKCLSINAKHKNDQILDLHGLKINGAMRVLKEFLQCKEEEFMKAGTPKMILLIITGQGKHSRNGSPIILPAVRNFLSQRKYRFHPGNPGTCVVILTRGSLNRKK